MSETITITAPANVDALRESLDEKLGELRRRAVHARAVLSPATYFNNPWVRCGVAVAVGFSLGVRRHGSSQESIVHSMIRTGLGTAISVLIAQTLLRPTKSGT